MKNTKNGSLAFAAMLITSGLFAQAGLGVAGHVQGTVNTNVANQAATRAASATQQAAAKSAAAAQSASLKASAATQQTVNATTSASANADPQAVHQCTGL